MQGGQGELILPPFHEANRPLRRPCRRAPRLHHPGALRQLRPPSTAAPSPAALTLAPAAANPAPPPTATATSATSSFKETARLDRELGSQVIPYPFQTCAVIQKPFDSGGPKHRRIYQGHEVLFCCTPCVRAFDANPEPYMPRIIAAAQAARNPAPGTSTPAP